MEVSQLLVQRVLRHVCDPSYRPVKPKTIAKQLDISPDDYPELRRVLKWLRKEGQIQYAANHLVHPPAPPVTATTTRSGANRKPPKNTTIQPTHPPTTHRSTAGPTNHSTQPTSPRGDDDAFDDQDEHGDESVERRSIPIIPARPGVVGSKDLVQGIFRRTLAGFGFLRPHGGDGSQRVIEEIYVGEGDALGALDGDTVEARMRPRGGRGGGVEGKIVRILERKRRQFTGTFSNEGSQSLVYLDGWPFDVPIAVGDVRGLPLQRDDKVVVEVVRFPGEDGQRAEGVILEVLGSQKNPALDTMLVMRQFGLPEAFPQGCIDDARAQADRFDESVPENRRDLTDLLTITIDPTDARDFDDAISLERTARGHWLLRVHIADVAHFVPFGSALDDEARQRATSVYLPDRVVPMIPELVSNHLASLQPERVRLTKTVEMEYSDDGIFIHADVYASAIRSDKRLNYDQVDDFLKDANPFFQAWGETVCELLQRMYALAMILRRRRRARGSIEMELPEVKIDLDKGGKVRGAHLVHHTESHQIIEEFMLAANQAVATWLDDQKLPFLRRIHPPPDRRKLKQLTRFVHEIGLQHEDVESRFGIQKILDSVRGSSLDYAVNYAVLKTMSKAVYGPYREGHYALDMTHYCHFTSPIRRYPDLTVHRLVQRVLDGVPSPADPLAVLTRLGQHCSDQEQNAESAERELVKLKLLHYLSKQIGEEFSAVVSRVQPDGLSARGLELPIDGTVTIDRLPTDRYRYERRGHVLEGYREGNQFRLGDRVRVRVERVDLRKRVVHFALLHKEAGSQRRVETSRRDGKFPRQSRGKAGPRPMKKRRSPQDNRPPNPSADRPRKRRES
jgi:ribonuclease R